MRTHVIEVPAPGFDHDAGLGTAAEPLQAQALVAEFSVEALIDPVLPGLAGVDGCGVDARVGQIMVAARSITTDGELFDDLLQFGRPNPSNSCPKRLSD